MEFLLCGFGGKITPKVIGDKSVAWNNCSLFENNLFLDWLTRQDLIDTYFELVSLTKIQVILIDFIIFSLLLFVHVTHNL